MQELIRQAEIHKFKKNDRWILFDVMEHSVSYIDHLTSDILDLFRRPGPAHKVEPLKEKYGSEAVTHRLDALIESGKLLFSSETRESPPWVRDTYEPGIYFSVNISQQCNMCCRYCYADNGTYGDPSLMSDEVGQKTIDFLFEESMRRGEEKLALTFFGGEPLLNMPLLRKMTQYVRERQKKFNKIVDLSIITNGTLIDEECARYLGEEKIRVTISSDGPKYVHDRLRVRRDGNSSYDAIMAGLPLLKAYGREIGARATVTRYNVHLSSIYKHLLKACFDTVAFSPVRDDTGEFTLRREDFKTLEKELDLVAEDFLEEVFKNKKFTLVNFVMPLVRIYTRHKSHFVCGAGNALGVITSKGDIFPCQSFAGMEEYKLGNVFGGINRERQKEFLKYADVDTRQGCKNCWNRYICGGECYHFSMIHTGSLKTTSRLYCHTDFPIMR